MANIEKLQYPSLPFANVLILKIRELEHDPYFFDKKVEYISLIKLIDRIIVLAACTNES